MSKLVLVTPDRELVDRAKRGDRDAFGQLAERYRGMCRRLAFHYMRNDADVEDQVQTSLLKAFVHLEQFNGDAAFSTWLARILICTCLMSLRSTRRYRPIPLAELPRKLRPASRLEDPESQYASRELREQVRREVARIHPMYRHALAHDLDELPVREVANRLGITIACAKSRVFRARSELRIRFKNISLCS